MKIIKGNKGEGKTTELVIRSNLDWKYIVCRDRQRADAIEKVAIDLNLDIPYPITVAELPLRSEHIESVLIDGVEDVLEYLIQKPVDFATTSCEVYTIRRVK